VLGYLNGEEGRRALSDMGMSHTQVRADRTAASRLEMAQPVRTAMSQALAQCEVLRAMAAVLTARWPEGGVGPRAVAGATKVPVGGGPGSQDGKDPGVDDEGGNVEPEPQGRKFLFKTYFSLYLLHLLQK